MNAIFQSLEESVPYIIELSQEDLDELSQFEL